MHVASRQRMVSEFMTIYTKKPWPTMPELPTVLFCCAMMEKAVPCWKSYSEATYRPPPGEATDEATDEAGGLISLGSTPLRWLLQLLKPTPPFFCVKLEL